MKRHVKNPFLERRPPREDEARDRRDGPGGNDRNDRNDQNAPTTTVDTRPVDGFGSVADNPDGGSAGQTLPRLAEENFEDGI
ncbi:MAG: hypothetical protein COB93_05855 [Sneathiella sp.]|nr:MAG: hypothetical protein COB93_05855 [Sneathiella sp.]